MSVQENMHDSHIAYWREELAGAPTKLELTTDKPRPSTQSFRTATEVFKLPKTLIEQLDSAGEQEQATRFMTLAAGFMTLLHRYTGQEDILVGTPIENESLIGTTFNDIVLRARFTGQDSFRALLRQVRDRAVNAYAHSDVPFEQVAEEFVPEPDPSLHPLVQVLFSLKEGAAEADASRAYGNRSTGSRTSKYDLAMVLSESEEGLQGSIEYSTDLFEAETVRRMIGHYQALLEGIAGDPDQNIAALPMLTDRERTQILYEWNDTRAEFPAACVHELIEQQAARSPDAIAVVFKEQRLSYRELNRRANQVAHYLRKQEVKPEVLVGVCLERCADVLIALLGIWKAGGAYVPLDPVYPKDRLAFMLKDAGAKVLLTDSKHENLFPSGNARTICMDSDWTAMASESADNPEAAATASNLAYVMYTSGSTGEPKGVMVLHGGLTNYLCWAVKAYAVEPGSSIPVHTSISFDLTVTGMYPPLLVGGTVEILPEDVGCQNLVAALRNGKDRSLIKITPAHLALLSQQIRPEEAAGRTRLFVIGGENLLAEGLVLWREFAPATRLINEYGPTETVVGCCVYEVQATDPKSGSVPIGRPIANTQLYVLDRSLNPVPLGAVGELYIGGAGVARGYLNRPELTEERFVADPFSGHDGARLYKTGDVARYRKDGTLEYMGRIDNQVKVRGYRIELGEIESTLANHPGVKSCAVLAREDEPGNKRLVGYVSLQNEKPPTSEELREFVRGKLPEYMVPSQMVVLNSIPLTTNGKIDRKALPAPSRENVSSTGDFVSPGTEIEKSLAAMWRELLKVDRIGIHDDFFNLGGHSLMAIKAVSRIRDVFGVDLPLATLLEAPTIAALSQILRQKDWAPSWSSLVPIRQSGSRPPLYLMHAHGGNVLDYHPLLSGLEPDQPVYGFQARGLDGHILKDLSLENMAAAYIEELRNFQPQGPYFLGGFCLGGLLALEAAEQLTAAGHEVALVVMIQSMHPDAMRFKPGVSALRRWWYKTTTRIQLEMDNLSYRGKGYVIDRLRRAWDFGRARTVIAFDKLKGKGAVDPSNPSKLYIFEALGMEHKKAMDKYVPGPYGGNVLVFRASKQIPGLAADEYLGWKRSMFGNLDVCEVPGYQQNLMLEPHVSQLAKELSRRLKIAQERYYDHQATAHGNDQAVAIRK